MSTKKKDVIPVYVSGGEDVVVNTIVVGSNVVTRIVYSPVVTVPVTVVVGVEGQERSSGGKTGKTASTTSISAGEAIAIINKLITQLKYVREGVADRELLKQIDDTIEKLEGLKQAIQEECPSEEDPLPSSLYTEYKLLKQRAEDLIEKARSGITGGSLIPRISNLITKLKSYIDKLEDQSLIEEIKNAVNELEDLKQKIQQACPSEDDIVPEDLYKKYLELRMKTEDLISRAEDALRKQEGQKQKEAGEEKKEEGYDPQEFYDKLKALAERLEKLANSLIERGYPVFSEEVQKAFALYNEVLDKMVEIKEKYIKKNKRVPSDVAYKIEKYIERAMTWVRNAEELPPYGVPEIVQLWWKRKGRIDEGEFYNYLKALLDKWRLARAHLYAASGSLKKDTFNMLKGILDDAYSVISSLMNKIRSGEIGESVSDEDIQKVAMVESMIAYIMSVAGYVYRRLSGRSQEDLEKNDTIKRLLMGDWEIYNNVEKMWNECARLTKTSPGEYMKCMKEKGFTPEEALYISILFQNLEKFAKGDYEGIPSPEAKIRWGIDDVTDAVFATIIPAVAQQWGSDYLKELAKHFKEQSEKEQDPFKKLFYDALYYGSLSGVLQSSIAGGFLSGAWVALLSGLTGGVYGALVGSAAALRGINELRYILGDDPVVAQQFNEFLKKAFEEHDTEALTDALSIILGIAAGIAGGYYIAKNIDYVKWRVSRSAKSLSEKLYRKALSTGSPAKAKIYEKLGRLFEKISNKYFDEIKVFKDYRFEIKDPEKDVVIKVEPIGFDENDPSKVIVRITYMEKGRVVGTLDKIKFSSDIIKRMHNIAPDVDGKMVIRQYIEAMIRNAPDDIAEKTKYIDDALDLLDDLLKYVEQNKHNQAIINEFRRFIDAVRSGKIKYSKTLFKYKHSGGLIVDTGKGEIQIITRGGGIKRIYYESTKDLIKIVSDIDDIAKAFGLKSSDELLQFLDEAFSHPEVPIAVKAGENMHLIIGPYRQAALLTPKGALEIVSSNKLYLRTPDKVIEFGRDFFRATAISKDGKYFKFETMKLVIPKTLSEFLKKNPGKIEDVIKNAVKLIREGKSEGFVKNYIAGSLGVKSSESLTQLYQMLQFMAQNGINIEKVIPVMVSTGTSTSGVAVTLSIIASTQALNQLAKTMTKQEARELLQSIKENLKLDTITVDTLAKTLGITREAAETILEKAQETRQKIIEIPVTIEKTIVLPQKIETTTTTTQIEEIIKPTTDLEIPVIYNTETIPVTIVLPQEVKHVVLPKTIEEQVELVVDTEIPVVEATETVHKTVVVPPQPRTKTIVVEKEETTTLPVDDRVEIIYITIPKTVTVVVPAYLEKWIPVEEAQPQPQPPPGKTTPAPPTPLPGVPAPPTGTPAKGTTYIKRGKQYEQIRI